MIAVRNQRKRRFQSDRFIRTNLFLPEDELYFGIMCRDNVRILLKEITEYIHPVPIILGMSGHDGTHSS